MESTKIAPFEATSIDSIPETVNRCKATFRSQITKPLEYRLRQLRQLYWGLTDYSDSLVEACKQDLGKPTFETFITEIDWCKNDILYVTKNLKKWMKDEAAPDISLSNTFVKPRIRKDPLGTVLIIGAYNFPVQLAVGPFIGAIAAGCTGVLKPSELSPATAMVLKTIFEKYLDSNAFTVVNGAISETTALLNEKWDKIFYTGSAMVGTIVAKKAAETLTPICLELGGLNPAVITKNADPRIAARRLLWGKLMNAGQVCISQNYVLVEKDILPAFVEHLKLALNEFYPNGQKNSPDYGRIVNQRHFTRIKKMLDETRGKVLIGGNTDEADNFIETTVVEVTDTDDPMIVNESFGPLIPILKFDGVDEAIRISNAVHSTPLGFYPFGNRAETDKMLNEVTSGGASVNDAFFHGSISNLAFGGVGYSGQGAYRGKASFDTFTHRRSITTTPSWMEKLLSVRYPPYDGKLAKIRAMNNAKPNFDRNCKEIKDLRYWFKLLLSLGSDSFKSALTKWAAVFLFAIVVNKFVDKF
ncbi:Beta-apo-4'-carotenal oxygenase [Golovinomyces cichoracearum]|uniref:Aldehyde dehydrogenase n=1 Tax=Golovinomyces cichoracearum TaxID=62708 RepID=A0A420J9U3_9PEZI|nr:Beta-apo-4'-carotenal oxygenase [Golovinomyces cichoracearum]